LDTGRSRIVKELHLKFVLRQGQYTVNGIGFNMADKFHLLQQKKPLDIVYTLDENDWNGEKSIQLKMIDLKLAEN
jgi:single-stranded-DNA-specific exonuclease